MLSAVWVFAVVAIAIGVAVAIALVMRTSAARPAEEPAPPPDDAVPEPLNPATEPSTPIAQLAEHVLPPDPSVIDSRYRVVGKLGADELGPAFEVERLADARRFSMRTLRRRGADRLNRFAREAQQAADIEHPNLVPVIDIGFTANDLFLVMPLVDGGSLEQVRHRFGDRAWAMPLIQQVASGLAALHERGVVHRGLRPSNVLLSRGIARITDIGLAALSRKTDQLLQPVEPSLDVLAFGRLAREMLSSTLGEEMPAWVTRCLADDPAARPTAAELVTLVGT